jgi:hypothetical protein
MIVSLNDEKIGLIKPLCESAPHPKEKKIKPAIIGER